METRPTKSEIGKTQKMVKALREGVIKCREDTSEKAIPNTETDNPVLDKLDSGVRVNRRATRTGEIVGEYEPRGCMAAS